MLSTSKNRVFDTRDLSEPLLLIVQVNDDTQIAPSDPSDLSLILPRCRRRQRSWEGRDCQ